MNFTDLIFLFCFLPITVLLYQPVKKSKAANFYILIASLIFYAMGSLESLFILGVVIVWNFISCQKIDGETDRQKRKHQMMIAAGVDLLILFFYRYLGIWFGFLDSALPLALSSLPSRMPAGLSFYLFSCLSALFDVYTQKARAPRSLTDFGVFAAFFGRVNMGPIAHYAECLPQLQKHRVTRTKNTQGAALLVQGLFRKVILADNFAFLFTALAGNTSWIGNLLFGFSYFFQLYFDFSGYSRMARGIGYLFGFEIPRNFNLPYTALSNQDFWRRWHISLTSWFREYVYIPLGGNRVRRSRWILNVFCVWILTGIWHGASLTFLVWGFLQGGLIVIEQTVLNGKLQKFPVWLRHLYVVICQLIGWSIFSAATLPVALAVIGRYFGIGIHSFVDAAGLFALGQSLLLLLLAILLSSGFSSRLTKWLKAGAKTKYPALQTAGYIAVLVITTAFLVSATARTFLYASF